METTTNYDEQAAEFLTKTGASIKVEYSHAGKYFPGDKEPRDIYNITISRGNREYSFTFGQSIANSGDIVPLKQFKNWFKGAVWSTSEDFKKKAHDYMARRYVDYTQRPPIPPSHYDILACLEKSDPGTFKDFCNDFGYSDDSITAKGIYEAVREQWLNIQKLFTDAEIEKMAEIQ